MTGIYNHIGFTKTVKIKNKIAKIKRLTVNNYINLIVNYRAWKLTSDKTALLELIKDNVITSDELDCNDMDNISDEIMKLIPAKNNSVDKTENEEKEFNWISQTIAFFAVYAGWKKSDVMDLYLDEVESLIEDIRNLNKFNREDNQDRTFQALYYAENKPEKYYDEVIKERKEASKEEVQKLDEMRKRAREWLNKSYGDKHAV